MSFLSMMLSSTARTWNWDSVARPICSKSKIETPESERNKNKQMRKGRRKIYMKGFSFAFYLSFGRNFPLFFSSFGFFFLYWFAWLVGRFLRNGKGRWAASYWYIRPTKIPNPTKQIWPDFVQRSSPNFSLLELIFWITRQAMQSKKSNQIKKQRWNRLIKYAQIYQTATRGLLYWFLRLGFYIEIGEAYKRRKFG